jgi:hypothetical protein
MREIRTALSKRRIVFTGMAMAVIVNACDPSSRALNRGGMPGASSGVVPSPVAEAQGSSAMPIRISRTFFEGELTGRLELHEGWDVGGALLSSETSDLSYDESSPLGDPPQPGALADYRNRDGCLRFEDASEVELCFVVQADVSDVGLNEKDTSWKGIEGWALSRAGVQLKDVRWVSAVRLEDGFQILADGLDVSQGAADGTAGRPVRLVATFRSF